MSMSFPISARQSGTWNTTLRSHDAWHRGHTWYQRWSRIGVVCSINIQNGRLSQILSHKEIVWKPVTYWADGEFWQTFWAHFRSYSVGVSWTSQLGQNAMQGWPWELNVNNIGCRYRKPPAVKIWHRGGKLYSLSLVIKQAMLLD